jgi:hypothetical protein
MTHSKFSIFATALGAFAIASFSDAHAQDLRQIQLSGPVFASTGNFVPSGPNDVTTAEFPPADNDAATGAFSGTIATRSLSHGTGKGASVKSGQKAKSLPGGGNGFEGLNSYQQRFARGGNQSSTEPPDQALCVGNGYTVEAVNTVFNVYDISGASRLPDNTATNIVLGNARNVNHAIDLNSLFGYPPEINRSTGVYGPSITDPSCFFDIATQRFFLVVLTIETTPNGHATGVNHLDIAVSQTTDPTKGWNVYRLDVTNDGTNTGGVNPPPYLGDYPHIGADAYGFYITTNSYPWTAKGFSGAQIYAMSKVQLAAGAASITVVHIDTSGMVAAPSEAGSTQPGFTVWPALSSGSPFNLNNGGTQFFLSSNATDEATHPVSGCCGTYTSSQLILWTLTNTSSLNTTSPAINLVNQAVSVNQYGIPPKQNQPGAGAAPTTATPQGYCINDTTTPTIAGVGCWQLFFTGQPAQSEVVSRPDANDTRIQQVMYANGKLWAALDTAVNPDGGGQRAGIEWFIMNPSAGKVILQGYLGAAGYDFTYPAIGVTASGRGVMAFTATGDKTYPSAAYAAIDGLVGVSTWDVASGGQGVATDDGFTSYTAQVGGVPPRTRWGDYGAVAVDGNTVWIASEYIAQSCDYLSWGGPYFVGGSGDNLLGTCAGPITSGAPSTGKRTALMNWSTRITQFTP